GGGAKVRTCHALRLQRGILRFVLLFGGNVPMRSRSWLRLLGLTPSSSKKSHQESSRKNSRLRRPRPSVERLEERTTPAAVLNTSYNGLNINQSNGGFFPPDTSGAVGPSCYVETVNQTIAIYTPKGTGTSSVLDSFNHFLFSPAVGNLPKA